MRVLSYSLGQLQTNCYFLIQENDLIIIDPADEASFITEEIQRQRLNLVAMLATHGHFDHLMAVGEIQKSFSVPLYINKKDQFLVDRLGETAQYFLNYKPIIFPILKIKNLEFSNSLKFKNFKFEILKTPGHTPGSVCFYFEKEKIIFTGDTLFKGSIGRYDFSYSNKTDLKKSLKKILSFPDDVIVYPGHGEKTRIKDEKKLLPNFFRNDN
ncbi:MAG: MBL fold metallo-hydrolase [Microgenomates group bacterium]